MEEEGRITGLRGHTRYARDVDMCAPLPVDELEVHPKGLARASPAHRYLALHAIEEQGPVTLLVGGDADVLAGTGRHEHLGLEAGGGNLGGLGHLGRQDAVLDEKHVGVEARPLVPGHHLADGPVYAHELARRQNPLQGDDVVELEELPLADTHPELEWRGISGPEDPTDCHVGRA